MKYYTLLLLLLLSCHNNIIDLESEEVIKAAKIIDSKLKAKLDARALREYVEVKTEATGIISTKISKLFEFQFLERPKTRFDQIYSLLKVGATYNKLLIIKGENSGNVISIKGDEYPKYAEDLIPKDSVPTAIINGGFFIHIANKYIDNHHELIPSVGLSVGPTIGREFHIEVPKLWKKDYGIIRIDNEVGICAGPMLSKSGKKNKIKRTDEKYKYFLPNGKQNFLNKRAGALTHCGEANERAAISTSKTNSDIALHTLTTEGIREQGATIQEWEKITKCGAKTKERKEKLTTLNLDGGNSIFMAVQDGINTKIISKGGDPDHNYRKIANLISIKPYSKEKESKLSIDYYVPRKSCLSRFKMFK